MVHAGSRQRASIAASYLVRENLRHMMKRKNSSCHQFNRWYGTMAFLKMKLEVGFWTREKSEALCLCAAAVGRLNIGRSELSGEVRAWALESRADDSSCRHWKQILKLDSNGVQVGVKVCDLFNLKNSPKFHRLMVAWCCTTWAA